MLDFETVTPDLWIANEEIWKNRLQNLPNMHQIPSINSNEGHNLPDGTLVRFQGMVQDMHNPEFYAQQYEVYNTVTNNITKKTGKYRETADVLVNEKVSYTENWECGQRHPMVVVSLPGLNEWAQQLENKCNHSKHLEQTPNTSQHVSNGTTSRRHYDEAFDYNDSMDGVESETINNKVPKTQDNVSSNETYGVSKEHILNFPLPDVSSKSCIVKVYDDKNNLKLNDMIEVVGFLCAKPTLSGEFDSEMHALEPQIETELEKITHNPPPSLVPRIHAVYVKKLEHCNPLVSSFDQASVLRDASVARGHLLKAFRELLLGDELAAEYLICHLISRVYHRQDALTSGKFCLNLSNLPIKRYPEYAKQLYDVLKQLVTKSYYLPFTTENLNTLAFLPKKDHKCDRLTSGLLQLSGGTHLVLDETKMEEGRLDATGLTNLTALGIMINSQQVEYDFEYFKLKFDSDVSVLLLTEGKAMLPSDFHVPLKPDESSLEIFSATLEATSYYLTEEIMNMIRMYITTVKLVKYTASENLQFVIDDFVEMRSSSNNETKPTGDDLHRLLELGRLVSLSRGYDVLTKECWDLTKSMEAERLSRLKNSTNTSLLSTVLNVMG